MKMTRFKFFIILPIVVLSTIVKAQVQPVNMIHVKINGTNLSYKAVFEQIEKQSGYSIDFSPNDIDINKTVKVLPKVTKLDSFLGQLLSPVSCTYEVSNGHIVLKSTSKKTSTQNPAKKISGVVTDANNQAVIGASVMVVGLNKGVITDINGRFTLDVPSNATIKISSIGYMAQTINTDNKENFDIILQDDSKALNEVVVVGYGTQKKIDLTGAVSSVKAKDFTPGVNYDAVQLLNGNASGVRISQVSSAPGASLQIQIRGAGSINSSNSVLFVVDGLPGVDPGSLSPEDIESIDVLKDASSSAIYGTRAANGVVLITTKKGKNNKTMLTYNSYFGVQTVDKKIDVLGASDYMKLVNMRLLDQGNPAQYSDEQISNAGVGTNWQDLIFRNATVQNHQLGISGGNDKGKYYVGINYFNQNGVVKKSDVTKYNVKANTQTKLFGKLDINTFLNFTRKNGNNILSSNSANEYAGPLNAAIHYDPTIQPGLDKNNEYYRNPSIALDNPEALINGITNEYLQNILYGSMDIDYKFLNHFTATARFGGRVYNGRTDYYEDRTTMSGKTSGGKASVSTDETTYWLAEYILKYNRKFLNKNELTVMGGTTYENTLSRSLSGSTGGFLSDVLKTDNLGTGDGDQKDNVGSGKSQNQLHGYIGRLTYSYDNRYLLTASFRIDGSSRFSDKNKYATFPSISLGWNLANEDFMKSIKNIDVLKLRVGYGEIGNQGINNYETRQTLVASSGARFVSGGQILQGVIPARLPNPNLVWERTREYNLGVDYGFFNNRINGSVDWYHRTTADQLFNKPLPAVVGFSTVRTNIGEVLNTGVDFNINTVNIHLKDWEWRTSLTVSVLKNKVTKLPDFTQELIGGSIGTFTNSYNITKVGYPIRSFYGYKIIGIFQSNDDIANSAKPNIKGYGVGMPKFEDQNGDKIINSADRVILGNGFPDLTFGIRNTIKYKRLTFDLYVTGVEGIKTLDNNVIESIYPTNPQRNSISDYFLKRWTPDNTTNKYPSGEKASYYGGAFAINSLTVKDASFLRVKNLTLAYSIPVAKKIFSDLQLYLAAENLFTLTNFEGFDPDANAGGTGGLDKISYNSYPLAKVFRIGMSVTF